MTQPHVQTAYQLGQAAARGAFNKEATISAYEAQVIREQLPDAIARIQAALQRNLLGTVVGQGVMGGALGAAAGNALAPGDEKPGQSASRSGALGGLAGATGGALMGFPVAQMLHSNPKAALLAMLGLPIAGALAGGYMGGKSAKIPPPPPEQPWL